MPGKTIKKKLIGTVTEDERTEIKYLFERKNGLAELFKSIDFKSDSLYDKVIHDMGKTSTLFQKWWEDKSKKYSWKGAKGHHWEVNFDTCEIFLIKD